MKHSGLLLTTVCLLIFVAGCAAKNRKIDANYSDPYKTFETWRQAAEALEFEILIESYASSSQDKLRKEIASTSLEGIKEMQREARKTKFKVEKVVYEDNRAYVRILRKRGRSNEIEIIRMIKEGPDWKLLP